MRSGSNFNLNGNVNAMLLGGILVLLGGAFFLGVEYERTKGHDYRISVVGVPSEIKMTGGVSGIPESIQLAGNIGGVPDSIQLSGAISGIPAEVKVESMLKDFPKSLPVNTGAVAASMPNSIGSTTFVAVTPDGRVYYVNSAGGGTRVDSP